MTTTFARIDPETLEVTLGYNTNGGAKWAEGDLECTVPFDVLASHAVRSESGNITLVADPTKVQAKTDQAWTSLRDRRNALLSQSDWTRLDDNGLTESRRAQWAEYRALLRDLPSTVTDPTQVEWPVAP